MSELIDKSSILGTKCELDLFTVPPTQVSIERGFWCEIHPKTTLSSTGPYEFQITRDPNYIDLNSNFLYMVLSITKPDGTGVAKASATEFGVAPINVLGKTFFKQIKVWLNNRLAYDSNDTYAYRALFETCLSYGNDAKNSHLQTAMYYKDTAGKMDSIPGNEGIKKRGAIEETARNSSYVLRFILMYSIQIDS